MLKKVSIILILGLLLLQLVCGQTPGPTPPTYPTGTFERTYAFFVYEELSSNDTPIAGATITVSGVTSATGTTDSSGNCSLTIMVHDTGTVSFSVTASGFNPYSFSGPAMQPVSTQIGLIQQGVIVENGLWFSPVNTTVNTNSSFGIDVFVTVYNTDVAAYGLTFVYDADLFSPDPSLGNNGVDAGPDGFLTAVNANIPGELSITGFDVNGVGPGEGLQLLTMNFVTGDTSGSCAIELDVDTLTSSDYANVIGNTTLHGTVTVEDNLLLGDVNGDAVIDIVDALMVARYSVGLPPAAFNADAADVNGDGVIDIVDALMIARYSVGLLTAFPG